MKTLVKFGLVALLIFVVALTTHKAKASTALPDKTIPGKVVFASDFVLKPGEVMDGDLKVVGARAQLLGGSTVKGDVNVLGGKLIMERNALVTGDLSVTGGQAIIGGHIKGDVRVFGGEVILEKWARIDGEVSTMGGVVHRAGEPPMPNGGEWEWGGGPHWQAHVNVGEPYRPERAIFRIFWKSMLIALHAIALGVLGGVAALFIPRDLEEVGRIATEEWVASGAVGIATAILFPIVIVALVLTILLILAVPLLLLIVGLLALLGWLGMGLAIGERLGLKLSLPWQAAIGAALLAFIADLVNLVPCVGWVVPAAITIWATGAAILWLYRYAEGRLPSLHHNKVIDAEKAE